MRTVQVLKNVTKPRNPETPNCHRAHMNAVQTQPAKRVRSKTTLERSPSQTKVSRLLPEIAIRPKTKPEISDFLSLTQSHVSLYLKILHDEGRIHICKWTRAKVAGLGSRPRPVWKSGPGIDARKPNKITAKQASRRQYARRKRDPDQYEAYLRASRKRMNKRNFKPRLDIAASWIVEPPPEEAVICEAPGEIQ